MANNKVQVDVIVDDKGSLQQVGKKAKAAAAGLDQAAKGSRTYDRNMKGASQQSANGTKNFSKMAQGMGGLVGVYATLAAQVFAVTAAYQFLAGAVNFNNLIEGQKALGAVTGVAYKSISNSIIEATNGQLQYAEAAKAAAIGTAGGISPSQLERLGAAAKNASIALGRDLGDSFDRLIRGVTKAEPELLDELGIILRLEEATEKYAVSIGKTRLQLSAYERSQAVANEVLEQAERKFGAMEKLMDPNAAALNQFAKAFNDIVNSLRDAIAGPVSAIATFLSENLYALIGALTLFSASVLKEILPSMSAWKESSVKAMEANKVAQTNIRAELEKTRLEYDRLNDTQRKELDKPLKKASKVLSGVEGSKKGQGAVDFLRDPNVNSKQAMAAANKALTNAEKQLGLSLDKRKSMFRKYNAEQIAILRAAYNAKKAIIDKGAVDFDNSTKKMRLSFGLLIANIKAGAIVIKGAIASIGATLATIGGYISGIIFWVSMLSIAFSAVKAAINWLYPASEETKQLNKQVKDLSEKYKTLGEEVGRTVFALNSPGLLTAKERIEAIGNAVGSVDVDVLIKNMKLLSKLDPSVEGYKELTENTLSTAKGLSGLSSEFKILEEAIKTGIPLTEEQEKSIRKLASAKKEAAFNSSGLADKTKATNAALQALIGTYDKPFGADFLTAAKSEMESATAMVKEYKQQLEEAKTALEELNNAPAPRSDVLASDFIMPGMADYRFAVASAQQGLKNAEAQAAERVAKAEKERLTAIEDKSNFIEDTTKQLTEQEKSLAALTASTAKIETITNRINALREQDRNDAVRAANMRTLGRNEAEKLANIEADRIERQRKSTALLETESVLQGKIASIEGEQAKVGGKLSEEKEAQLAVAKDQLKQTEKSIVVMEAGKSLEEERSKQQEVAVKLEGELLRISAERLAITRGIANEELRLKNIQSGGTGLFGFERTRAVERQQGVVLQQRLLDARNDLAAAEARLFAADAEDPTAVQSAQKGEQTAKSNLAGLIQENYEYENKVKLLLLAKKGETEFAAARLQTLALNPIDQQYRETLLAMGKEEQDLSAAQQKALYAETEAQYFLNEAYENKAQLFSSLESNMTSAFTALVTGTKTAKQAFADMAVAILSDIAQMVTRMLVMRALMSFFGGGPTLGASTSASAVSTGLTSKLNAKLGASIPNFTAGKRYGGVTQPPPGYATGGIARGSDAGYPAILHGTEAVVPLPNNRSIPVDLKGAGQQNNVTVNVSVANDGKASQDTQASSNQGANLGAAIAAAVQKELQNQKRSGGILNPYGVA